MTPTNILAGTERRRALQELATPPDFWSVIEAEFEFQIDVCAHGQNAKCEGYIDSKINALDPSNAWLNPGIVSYKAQTIACGSVWQEDGEGEPIHRAWCNPGFSKVLPWHLKAHAEAQKHPSNVVVVIGLPGGSQDWFRFAYQHASEIRMLADRVQYLTPDDIGNAGNSRESWVFVYRRKLTTQPAQIFRDDWRARL